MTSAATQPNDCLAYLQTLPPRQHDGLAAVAFDFGGVVQPKGPAHNGVIAQGFGASEQQVAAALKDAQKALKRGQQDEAAFWQGIAAAVQGHVPADWRQIWQAHISAAPLSAQVQKLCQDLLHKGYMLPLCANTTPWRAAANEARGAYAAFWPRILSCEVGLVKPDAQIFALLAKACALQPEQMLFVDDKPRNVAAAKDFGMQAMLWPKEATA